MDADSSRDPGDRDDPKQSRARQDRLAEDRDVSAGDRDRRADAHDRESDKRDRRADARDDRALNREQDAVKVDSGAVADRSAAKRDRKGGASDRQEAADDRVAAADDRVLSAHERRTHSVDHLTGVYRREVGMAELDREIIRAKRTTQPFLLAFVDVDNLKATNDTHGHQAGDELLRYVADSLRAQFRAYDLIVRYGGDEFLCGLIDVDTTEALKRFEQVNADLETHAQARISVGIAVLGADDALEDVIVRADEALYAERQRRDDMGDPDS